ncbi:MAG: U32 family peptidase [Sphaerochaeta sp.]|nr:U32 family peptidase [Sphaerochaeta sp.]MDX9914458.1 U32 family peptidase [Sphaerochaeta sp.]
MGVELLSPAGSVEKLRLAFAYGADAAYLGLSDFSLRTRATNFSPSDLEEVKRIKEESGKRLYCTMNMLFDEERIERLRDALPAIKEWPFDAYIISDMALVKILRDGLGAGVELHLSTQASATNSESVAFYGDLGFRRVILGRETPLSDIRRIKERNRDLELEVFVHGAMCMAYSGRCLLSSAMTGRSANKGDCAHSCRWKYRLALEEERRPGHYLPIEEEGDHTTILSSADLCMIDHLQSLVDSGVSSLKIEGRMKSSHYVAVVTRAYRKALDALSTGDESWREYRKDLFAVSHRQYSTGFFFPEERGTITEQSYERAYLFCGLFEEEVSAGVWALELKNQLKAGMNLEYITPDIPVIEDDGFTLLDEEFNVVEQADHPKRYYLKTDKAVVPGAIIRRLSRPHEQVHP